MLGITYYNQQYYGYQMLVSIIHDFKTVFEEIDFLDINLKKGFLQTGWSEV